MMERLILAGFLVLVLHACGVKNDLLVPNGQPPMDDEGGEGTPVERDPSLPPQPLGQ